MGKKALICGVSGQDGAYLARLLIEKGYEVIGASRDAASAKFDSLVKLGVLGKVTPTSISLSDFRSILQVLVKHSPDEIYNLSAQSSVGLSFEQPVETIESITLGTLNLLEAIRFTNKNIRLYNAGSSEIFGDTGSIRADENTPFRPRSPYAVAKAAAHNLIDSYREAYGLFSCNGILFNHESPLRQEKFVTQKIIRAAQRISMGANEKLIVGRIDIERDWGWAPEYVEAMWLMLQQDNPENFVIATGKTVSLEYFIRQAFNYFNLNYKEHIEVNPDFYRPSDISFSLANPEKAKNKLGWQAQTKVEQVIENMCNLNLPF